MANVFISEDPTDTSSKYSGRISQRQWSEYKSVVERLHNSGMTRRKIMHELARDQFYPSFGQLVAQMTRWRMVRYSKSRRSRSSNDEESRINHPSGILCLCQLLSNGTPDNIVATSNISDRDRSPPLNDLTILVSALNLKSSSEDSLSINEPRFSQSLAALKLAWTLYLGEAYDHAFIAYHTIVEQLMDEHTVVHLEQMCVKALIGCLKSAVTSMQQQQAIQDTTTFIAALIPTGGMNPQQPQSPMDIMRSWHNPDYATAKIVHDLLTYYKACRAWNTPMEAQWAHDITLVEWTVSRLIRLPVWQEVSHFLSNLPLGDPPDAVFTQENRRDLLEWLLSAFNSFEGLFRAQLVQLQQHLSQTTGIFRTVMFWRLRYFAAHLPPPSLQIALDDQTAFPVSVEATCCILSCAISHCNEQSFDNFDTGFYGTIRKWCTSMDSFSEAMWEASREVFAPTRSERQASISRSQQWLS